MFLFAVRFVQRDTKPLIDWQDFDRDSCSLDYRRTGRKLVPARRRNEALSSRISPYKLGMAFARLHRVGEPVAASRPYRHEAPLGMVDQEDVSQLGAAILTVAIETTKIVRNDQLPIASGHSVSVFFCVTAFAKRFAFVVAVFPGQSTPLVSFVMKLKNNSILARSETANAASSIQFDAVFPELEPFSMAI